MNVRRLRRRARRADGKAARLVGVGNVLLCGVLFLVAIGGVGFFEATTRAQETAWADAAGSVYGCWLAGGLMVFSVLGMMRTLLTHLTTMFLVPVVSLILVLLLVG
ncbi:hypothetical protein [Streptomyces sp. NPDC049585]|uniref:hypothetical protein n=1 Tax=Streptomyces sp. NPDC049585 TaxID=3155154 RepID=UPI003429D09F